MSKVFTSPSKTLTLAGITTPTVVETTSAVTNIVTEGRGTKRKRAIPDIHFNREIKIHCCKRFLVVILNL